MAKMLAFNLLYYKPKLWETIVLWFCPLRTHEAPDCVLWYKRFSNRMYIYGYIRSAAAEPQSEVMEQRHDGFENAGNN